MEMIKEVKAYGLTEDFAVECMVAGLQSLEKEGRLAEQNFTKKEAQELVRTLLNPMDEDVDASPDEPEEIQLVTLIQKFPDGSNSVLECFEAEEALNPEELLLDAAAAFLNTDKARELAELNDGAVYWQHVGLHVTEKTLQKSGLKRHNRKGNDRFYRYCLHDMEVRADEALQAGWGRMDRCAEMDIAQELRRLGYQVRITPVTNDQGGVLLEEIIVSANEYETCQYLQIDSAENGAPALVTTIGGMTESERTTMIDQLEPRFPYLQFT